MCRPSLQDAETKQPGLTGIVLAAGLSRRAAPVNKLLAPFGAVPVVRATASALCGAGLEEVIVVTGHERERVEEALAGLAVRFVFAERFAQGMGHSLAAGVRAARDEAGGFAVCPGDLPFLSARLMRRLAAEFARLGGRQHIIPLSSGARGHPVVLGAWLRSELEALTGDEGAKRILGRPEEAERCRFLEVEDDAIWRDVDRPAPDGCGGR